MMDMKRQQDSVLYRLDCLKAELSRLSVARKELVESDDPSGLAEQQQSILRVIKTLKEELEFIGMLQKKIDPKVSTPLPYIVNIIFMKIMVHVYNITLLLIYSNCSAIFSVESRYLVF